MYLYIIPTSWVRLTCLAECKEPLSIRAVVPLFPGRSRQVATVTTESPIAPGDATTITAHGAEGVGRGNKVLHVVQLVLFNPGCLYPETQRGCYNIYLLLPSIDHTSLSVWVVEVWMENGLEVGYIYIYIHTCSLYTQSVGKHPWQVSSNLKARFCLVSTAESNSLPVHPPSRPPACDHPRTQHLHELESTRNTESPRISGT